MSSSADSASTSTSQLPKVPIKFEVFVQPVGTIHSVESREKVDANDAEFTALFNSATDVLSHFIASPLARAHILGMALMMYSLHVPAAEAFTKRWGQDIPPTDKHIVDFLNDSPPNLILAFAPDLEKGFTKNKVCWGLVNKESDHNEIFLPIDLARRLRMPDECTAILHTHQRLIWHIAYSHELVHAILMHLFPKTTTPHLPGGILGQDNKGQGESGHQFELIYFGFQLAAEWKKKEAKDEMRMDKILRLLGKVKSKTYELNIETVNKILYSFQTLRVYMPDFGQTMEYRAPYAQPDQYGRFCVGECSSDDEEEDQDDTEEIAAVDSGMQNVGLGLQVAGAKFVGCRLVMETESE